MFTVSQSKLCVVASPLLRLELVQALEEATHAICAARTASAPLNVLRRPVKLAHAGLYAMYIFDAAEVDSGRVALEVLQRSSHLQGIGAAGLQVDSVWLCCRTTPGVPGEGRSPQARAIVRAWGFRAAWRVNNWWAARSWLHSGRMS